jgi:hypothetical protein
MIGNSDGLFTIMAGFFFFFFSSFVAGVIGA